MTFDELWVELEKLHILPDAAIKQMPQILSSETKKRLSRKKPEEASRILSGAIEQINRGSIETVDALTRKKEKMSPIPPAQYDETEEWVQEYIDQFGEEPSFF